MLIDLVDCILLLVLGDGVSKVCTHRLLAKCAFGEGQVESGQTESVSRRQL